MQREMSPTEGRATLRVVDTHYGGDVSRIVLGGVRSIPSATLQGQVQYLRTQGDGLRRLLIYAPHGSPQMSANLVVAPVDDRADVGLLTMEAMGYPPFSGSNTLCAVTALLESGMFAMPDGTQALCLESPGGLVDVSAECRAGRVTEVTCETPPVFVLERDVSVPIPARGEVQFDLVWSGCFYAVVDAEPLALFLAPEERDLLAQLGAAIVEAANAVLELTHPALGPMGPLAFVHFGGPRTRIEDGLQRSRSVTYVHPGVVCRCPTGTGTSARLALLAADGLITVGERLETVAPDDSSIVGALTGTTKVGAYDAVRTSISGRAWTLARCEIVVDLADPMIVDQGLSSLLEHPA